MHEGSDDTPGVFMLGERPVNQLLPATHWIREQHGVRRWVVVGNDYVYPRVTGSTATEALAGSGIFGSCTQILFHSGTSDFRERDSETCEQAPGRRRDHAPDGAGRRPLQPPVRQGRLERTAAPAQPGDRGEHPAGAGPSANKGLYAAAAYFDGLATVESGEFARDYYARFGAWAPALNAVGESCYEAVRFLARLGEVAGSIGIDAVAALPTGHFYDSPRGLLRLDGNLVDQDVYLAVADGLEFTIEDQIAHIA